jgi:cell division septal protein FtsQ
VSDADATRGSRPFRWRLALGGVVLLLIGGAPWWGPLLLRRLDFFRVRRVEVVGARYVQPRDLLARLHVDTTASVWDPLGPLERRVSGHPQVRRVEIERRLPGTLVVNIDEWLPVALVPSAKGLRPYDERGVALPIDPARTLVDAPVLTDRDVFALRLLSALRAGAPGFYARLQTVRPVAGDELLLQLPSLNVRAMKNVTIDRLAEIEPVQDDLARRQLKVAELDLRYRDQVIARLQ